MGELAARVCAEGALLAAWEQVRERAYDDGDPGTAVAAFEHAALRRLTALAQALRDGSWQPRPVTEVEIPNPSGGVRRLAVGAVEDRIVERAVLPELDRLIDPLLSPWSFAYRRGLGVADAIRALAAARDAGARWVARADIDDCFDEIPRWEVLRRLREVVHDGELLAMVERLMDRPVAGAGAGDRGRGLRQGSATSPLLANLYLDAFDRRLISAGYQPVRYSDDIAIPAPDRAAAERALELAAEAAEALRLRLNEAKTRLVSFDDGVPFCGQVVTATSGARVEPSAHPLRGTVYVTTQGALVRSKGDRVRVEDGETLLSNLNVKRVRQVVCVGRVGVTSALVHRAVAEDIELVWLDDDGRYSGRLTRLEHGDAELRLAQYRAAGDERAALRIARQAVAGKVTNMRVGLLRAARNRDQPDLAEHSNRLAEARRRALAAANHTELMGHEGAATRDYFDAFGRALGPDWKFTHRQRRPPPDPVNAMLSFGYTLLANEAVAACEIAGLDPFLGFLHATRRGRPSLALDLMEEFRPVLVDATVVRLARAGQVTPADFASTAEGGCRMADPARHAFLAAYEARLLTLVHHLAEGRRVSWRQAIAAQASQVAAVVAGRLPDYRPVIWR